MTNEELKEKITKIALTELQVQFGCGDTVEIGDREACAESITDALIAEGLTFEPIVIRTVEPSDECEKKIHEILKEEEAIIEEVKHRALVAERALRIVAKEIPCDGWCPFSQKCTVELNGENMYQCCFDEYLKQAEKELSEEKKDD